MRNYSRVLDMPSATSRVAYVEPAAVAGTFGAVAVQRDSFVSAAHQVLVVRTTCVAREGASGAGSAPCAMNSSAVLARLVRGNASARLERGGGASGGGVCWLTMLGRVREKGGLHFAVCAALTAEQGGDSGGGAHLAVDGASCVARGASATTVILAIVSSFRAGNPEASCARAVRRAAALPYDAVSASRLKFYRYMSCESSSQCHSLPNIVIH